MTPRQQKLHEQNTHAHFDEAVDPLPWENVPEEDSHKLRVKPSGIKLPSPAARPPVADRFSVDNYSGAPHLHNLNSPYYIELQRADSDYFKHHAIMDPAASQRARGVDGSASPAAEEKMELTHVPLTAEEAPPTPKLM
ncbi:MAG: hypothetical protein M1823_008881, partial [Watsoniomyces obsoletus]